MSDFSLSTRASLRAELDGIDARGLRRRLRAVVGPQEAELEVDGRRVINFSSNNYLGLANHPALVAAATAAMAREGFGAGASRLIVGNLAAHRALEERIARWKGTEAALLFNSGYHANVGVLSALAGPEDVIYSDALNHASLIDGARLSRATVTIYPHGDVATLHRLLEGGRRHRRRFIVSDSVFSMDGDLAPIAELSRLARSADALLIVDEAHAVGVFGDGAGPTEGLERELQVGTLGKALGTFGAYVAGERQIVELLVQRARSFIFTTALPVPVAAAATAAIDLIESEEGRARRERLAAVGARFHAGLARIGLAPHRGPCHIVPLFVADPERAMAVCEALLARGIYAQGIRPPTVPPGTSRLRFTLMAIHRDEHVDAALAAITALRSELRGA